MTAMAAASGDGCSMGRSKGKGKGAIDSDGCINSCGNGRNNGKGECVGAGVGDSLSRCLNTSGHIYFYDIVCTKTNYDKIHLSKNKMLWT